MVQFIRCSAVKVAPEPILDESRPICIRTLTAEAVYELCPIAAFAITVSQFIFLSNIFSSPRMRLCIGSINKWRNGLKKGY